MNALCKWCAVILLPVLLGACPGEAGDLPSLALRTDGTLEFLRPDGTVAAVIDIEIAATAEARAKGLMGRRLADFSQGMLFIWEDAAVQHFWMRDTPTSLDIIFVREDGRIVSIAPRTLAMSDTVYTSEVPVQFVVEVSGGFVDRFGIKAGGSIRWQRP